MSSTDRVDAARRDSRSQEEIDFLHTVPGALAGRYMRMFWQPICRTEDLEKGRAVSVRVMGEDSLYRGQTGKPYLLEFRCAHRGAQLSIAHGLPEHLGRSDKVVVMRRKIWERELSALAQGKPLKRWRRPDWLEAGNERGDVS